MPLHKGLKSVVYHKTKNPFGANICMTISFQPLFDVTKLKSQEASGESKFCNLNFSDVMCKPGMYRRPHLIHRVFQLQSRRPTPKQVKKVKKASCPSFVFCLHVQISLFVFSPETWNVMTWDGLVQPTGKYCSIRHYALNLNISSNGRRPRKSMNQLIFSWLSCLAVLLVGACAQWRRRSRARWRPCSSNRLSWQ